MSTRGVGRGQGWRGTDACDPVPRGWPGVMTSWTPAQRTRFAAVLASPEVAGLRPRDRFVEAYRAVVLMGRRAG